MFSGWKSILVQNGINRSKSAKGSQNVKNNLIDHLGPLESKRSFQATFSDEIGRWEVSKPNYLIFGLSICACTLFCLVLDIFITFTF